MMMLMDEDAVRCTRRPSSPTTQTHRWRFSCAEARDSSVPRSSRSCAPRRRRPRHDRAAQRLLLSREVTRERTGRRPASWETRCLTMRSSRVARRRARLRRRCTSSQLVTDKCVVARREERGRNKKATAVIFHYKRCVEATKSPDGGNVRRSDDRDWFTDVSSIASG